MTTHKTYSLTTNTDDALYSKKKRFISQTSIEISKERSEILWHHMSQILRQHIWHIVLPHRPTIHCTPREDDWFRKHPCKYQKKDHESYDITYDISQILWHHIWHISLPPREDDFSQTSMEISKERSQILWHHIWHTPLPQRPTMNCTPREGDWFRNWDALAQREPTWYLPGMGWLRLVGSL